MAFEIYREPLYRRYYAPLFSGACLYTIVYSFVLIFLPLIIVYNAHDFWWKEGYYLEQPTMSYQYLANFQWYGIDSSTNQAISFSYSTHPSINQLYTDSLRVPVVKTGEFDDNKDGVNERLELCVLLPLQSHELIYGFSGIVYFYSELKVRAKYAFDSAAFLNYESGTPMNELQIDGDMLLRQSQPFSLYGGYHMLYADDPLFSVDSYTSANDVSIESVMRKYNARNVSLFLRPRYEYVSKRGHMSPSMIIPGDTLSYFNSSIIIRYPVQPISYTPPISAVLKVAWIQYMSLFLVVGFLLFTLNSFIFRHQLLYSHTVADISHEKHH